MTIKKKSVKKSTNTLAIVLLSYNGSFWLKKTLETLDKFYLKKTKTKVEVWLVDNASTDDSVAMTKESFPWVKLIENEKNVGFAAGNNVALKQITTPYIMLLNTDVELTNQSNFDILIDYIKNKKDVAMIGPKVLLSDGGLDMASHRGEPTLWASFTYMSKLEKLFPKSKIFGGYHQLYKDLNTIHEVDAITGAAMLLKKTAMDKVGLLDEDYFLYAEDLDWCKRFKDHGYKIIYNPEVEVIHHKNKSGIENKSIQIRKKSSNYFHDTMLIYYDKHYANKYPKFVRPIVKFALNIKKGGL
ncbi:MAG: glycosyltransferase [Pseudomonadales bacterium]|jgi:GT2 family glycosyltransferase|nr:glycosyltransferase [Pseudomonadales bacterium]